MAQGELGAYHVVNGSEAFKAMVTGNVQGKATWLLDSGCNVHILNDKEHFITYRDSQQLSVRTADHGVALPTMGSGRAVVECKTRDGQTHKILLKRALYTPNGQCNLISQSALLADGRTAISGDNKGVILIRDNLEIMYADTQSSLYHIRVAGIQDTE